MSGARWPRLRLKFVSAKPICNGVGEPSDHAEPSWPRYIRITDIAGPRALREDTFRSLPPEIAAGAPLDVGDVLVAAVGATFGKAYLHQHDIGPACFAGYLVRVRPNAAVRPAMLAYWMESQDYWDQVRTAVVQATVQNFSAEKVRQLRMPLPPVDIQRAIAAFLDRKTAEIDALIAKKDRLLELLDERRTALITQAVTKGITPGTSLKETGEDWLGTVPAHWRLLRLKFVALGPLSYGASEAAESTDPTLPRFVRITDLGDDGTLRDETFKSLPEDVAAPYLLREGDLLFARSGATVGKSFRYDPSWGRAAYAGYLVRARLDDRLALPRFVWLFAQSASYWGWVGRNAIQSTIQNVSAERYSGLLIPLPSVDEQRSVVRFVEEKTAQLAALAGQVREAMALLREYRTALITAAVTGQMEVPSL